MTTAAICNSTDNGDDTLYSDWKAFLKADRTDLRLAAVTAVLHVRDVPGMTKCVQQELVPLLAKNVSYSDEQVALTALTALLHLSSNGPSANQCVQDLMDAGGLNRMLEIVLSKPEGKEWKKRVNFGMSLLANMTRTETGAVDLVGRSLPEEATHTDEKLPAKPTLELLLARFLNMSYVDGETDYTSLEEAALDSYAGDPFQHFGSVLMNSTQTEVGRKFVLKIQNNNTVLQVLLPQLKSSNPIRRRGIAGTIRNCCVDRDSCWWYLNVLELHKKILYPLAGPEELDVDEKQGLDPDLWLQGPDKVREPDQQCRLFLCEAILLLCTSGRKSRERLRLDRAYVILKLCDMVEENEDVSERIYDCVNFLRRDEEGTAEGSSDKIVEDTYGKPTAARKIGTENDDFDDVD